MAGPQTSRLAHFLAGYAPLDPRIEKLIYERVQRLGCSLDDPTCLYIAIDTLVGARGRKLLVYLQEFGDNVEQRVAKEVSAAHKKEAQYHAQAINVHHARIEKLFTQRLDSTVRDVVPKLEKAVQRGAFARYFAVVMLIGALATIVGYVWGRHDTGELGAAYAEAATSPNAAGWLALQSYNGNIDELINNVCFTDNEAWVDPTSGRAACALPLWIEPRDARAIAPLWQKLTMHVRSLPALVFIFFGGLAGLILGSAVRPSCLASDRRDVSQ